MSQKNVVLFHPSLPALFFSTIRLLFFSHFWDIGVVYKQKKWPARCDSRADNTLKIIDFGIAAHFEALELEFFSEKLHGSTVGSINGRILHDDGRWVSWRNFTQPFFKENPRKLEDFAV